MHHDNSYCHYTQNAEKQFKKPRRYASGVFNPSMPQGAGGTLSRRLLFPALKPSKKIKQFHNGIYSTLVGHGLIDALVIAIRQLWSFL